MKVQKNTEFVAENLKNENEELLGQVKNAEKKAKDLKKVISEKDKEIHDLRREHKIDADNF